MSYHLIAARLIHERRRLIFWDEWHRNALKVIEQIERDFYNSFPASPFRHDFAADNRQTTSSWF